ncbi:MAG TPA: hypothetical protein VGL93_13220 [Streptosporangiaceae bacterium]|jgi:hypothetical protein
MPDPSRVLRVRLAAPDADEVLFEAVTAPDAADTPAVRHVTSCTLADLGLAAGQPAEFGEMRPDAVDVAAIAAALRAGPLAPVWLDLPSPRGLLHLVPWEAVLLPLYRPVWRLCRTAPYPRPDAASLTVAVCAGDWPEGPRGLPRQPTNAWSLAAGRIAEVRVFFDAPPPREREVDLTDPWLLGVRDALDGTALDVLHLVAPGVFTGGHGGVAAPASATPGATAHVVDAAEISAFLGQTGAWCLVLTGSSRTGSMAALRDVADAVASARPCVVVAHDADEPYGPPGDLLPAHILFPLLPEAYSGRRVLPPSAAVACWTAPSAPRGPVAPLAARTNAVLSRRRAPGWVASYLRDMEARSTELRPGGDDSTADPDVAAAQRHLAARLDELVDRYVAPLPGE